MTSRRGPRAWGPQEVLINDRCRSAVACRHRFAVIRWIGIVIPAAVVLLGLIWVAFDTRKQCWHDKMASTFVVHTTR